jgi:hypothetical protein
MTEYKVGDILVCIKYFGPDVDTGLPIYSLGESYTIDSIPFSGNYIYISEGIHFGRHPFFIGEINGDFVPFLLEDYFVPLWKWREMKILTIFVS